MRSRAATATESLGRPLTRTTARNGQTVNDSFGYNTRRELTSAQINGIPYGYDYDNIGNRTAALEESSGAASRTAYTANELNQYTSIQENEDAAFVPVFDADGNQTLVKTSTGIWNVEYNAENRPICFTSEDKATVIECTYDSMGRRVTKKVTTNGSITLHQRYIYRGYLQIACCDLTRSAYPCLWLLTWDPTQPIGTRPLAIRKDGTWYAYSWDISKNICEVFGPAGYLRTAYTYTPYGQVTSTGDVDQPLQWGSEMQDEEMGLVYYNYRFYNHLTARWISKDAIYELGYFNLYSYAQNNPVGMYDILGRETIAFNDRPCMQELAAKYPGAPILASDVYISSGGNVEAHYNANKKICEKNSCALRVSKSLANTNSEVDLEKGLLLKMGEVHFKSDKDNEYNILEADALRKYITRLWGEPDIKFEKQINPEAKGFNERVTTDDWGSQVKNKCGIVFYIEYKEKGAHATHTGLIVDGKPYKDPSGRTNRLAYIWFVPCSCNNCCVCDKINREAENKDKNKPKQTNTHWPNPLFIGI